MEEAQRMQIDAYIFDIRNVMLLRGKHAQRTGSQILRDTLGCS